MARRRFNKQPTRQNEPRINHRIQAQQLRVVVEGEGQFVMTRLEALDKAKSLGLDLVELSPDQDPPVCKIIDYGKYKYEQQKKKKEQTRNQHTVQIKEIKMRPKIGGNDYDLKKRNGIKFLEHGDKVKVTLRFRGREITHPELGFKLLQKFAAELKEYCSIEFYPKFEGRQIVMVLAPNANLKRKVATKKDTLPKKEVEGSGATEKVAASQSDSGNG